jgi:hypothetical protein
VKKEHKRRYKLPKAFSAAVISIKLSNAKARILGLNRAPWERCLGLLVNKISSSRQVRVRGLRLGVMGKA